MIATNALLAREGYSTPFYFDLRHGEELSEKAINQLKTCAADLYGQDGQIILCREITPVLRMMANGLDVPILLSVPVLRNEKEITRQFYKALKNNAHEVAAGQPLASVSSALLKSLGAENLLISKLDSTGPGLWKVDQSIFVTSPSSLVPAPGPQMSLQTEQALHVSLSSSAVDALTIVEVVRLLKSDDYTAGADNDSGADDIGASDANKHHLVHRNDNVFDSHTDHPLSDHHSSHSSCHSDLSVLASTIPDLAAVQALAHFATPTEAPNRSLNSVDVTAKGTDEATKPTNMPTTQPNLPRKMGSGSEVTGYAGRAASFPISSSPTSAQQLKTVSAPAPARRSLSNGASVSSHKQSPTQTNPLLAPSNSSALPTAPPLSTTNSNAKPKMSLPPWMQELQQARRNPTPLFTPTSQANQPPPFQPPVPPKLPSKRKDWSISTESDSDIVVHQQKRARESDRDTGEPARSDGDKAAQNQRPTIQNNWVMLTTKEAISAQQGAFAGPMGTPNPTPTAVTPLRDTSTPSPNSIDFTSTPEPSLHIIDVETEAFLTPKRRTAVLLKQVTASSQSGNTTAGPVTLNRRALDACVDHTTPVATKSVTEICDTVSQSSTITNTTDTLLQTPLQQPLSTLFPTSVRHATTCITMYASTCADYERLSDFLEYALTEAVQQRLRSLTTPVAVYRGNIPPALPPEVVCVELNQNTLPASAFEELVRAQLALRCELPIKVEEED